MRLRSPLWKTKTRSPLNTDVGTSETTCSSCRRKMKTALCLLAALTLASCRPADDKDKLAELENIQAQSAKYHFSSDVQDGISDLSHQREEIRDGLKVRGFYSYSDGHYKRKVNYIADENGYRIESEEVEPLEGPLINPEGIASVRTVAHGNEVSYSVEGDDKTRHEKNLRKLKEDAKI